MKLSRDTWAMIEFIGFFTLACCALAMLYFAAHYR